MDKRELSAIKEQLQLENEAKELTSKREYGKAAKILIKLKLIHRKAIKRFGKVEGKISKVENELASQQKSVAGLAQELSRVEAELRTAFNEFRKAAGLEEESLRK